MMKYIIQMKLNELVRDKVEKDGSRLYYFLSCFDKAVEFYSTARTGLERSTEGENERAAERYVKVLIGPSCLNIKHLFHRKTGMQILGILSAEEVVDYVEGIKHAIA